MIQSKSSRHAKSYFSDAFQQTDYYLDNQELPGQFLGRLADRINVNGPVTKDHFFALCENINPADGNPLTVRNKANRTIGYDINFHCPKSVSILHVLIKDDHILSAFQKSVNVIMHDIERDSMTRVRKNGIYEDRPTGELIWAEFTHQTARPVDGSVPDPHLHSHCFVFNATWDEQEQRIKAGQFREIKRDMPYYQARFHKILSDNLIDAGYQIRLTDKSFEVVGVPQTVIDLFCKRTNEIGQFAKEQGITDAKALSNLGARTRAKKQKSITMADLKTAWRKQISEQANYQLGETDAPIRFSPKQQGFMLQAQDCLNFAIEHAFERASVMPQRRLLAMAYRHSIGTRSVAMEGITSCFTDDPAIIHIKEHNLNYCTTTGVLAEEQRMVNLARKGQGKFPPLYRRVPAIKSTGQQALAIEHILITRSQVSIIRGAAGSGKTTLMKEAKDLIEAGGKQLIVVAPTAQASRHVLKSEGFENAETVARLLIDKELQRGIKDQVLWVDEAGLLGTREMTALLELADKHDAQLILGGDPMQHASVVRGDALRILSTVAGITTIEVNKIYRQKNIQYKAAVQDLAKGDVQSAFTKLTDMGSIKEVDPLKPNVALIDDYVKAVKKGKSVLIVSPTHHQGDAVTEELRSRLKAIGRLDKKDVVVAKYKSLNLTEAQKSDWRNFETGQIVQFNQNVPKIKRGSVWTVNEISQQQIRITNSDGESQLLPLERNTAFNLYHRINLGVAKGDEIKVTKNSFDKRNKRLNNGDALRVQSVSESGNILLINPVSKAKFELDKEFGNIDHNYCTTSHSAQGKTVDEVLISQPAATFSATDAKQFYVSVSRGRDAATIYTDDRIALLEYASALGNRQSALELIGNKDNRKGNIEHIDWNDRFLKNAIHITKETPSINKGIELDHGLEV